MKNYFWLTALLCCFYSAQAQVQTPLKTINFQALIVDPAVIDLPGGAIQAQLYVNKEVWIRFAIYAGSTLQYEELHKTKTDAHGLINLEIGAGENTGTAGTYISLNWGGPVKNLVTQVSFDLGAKYTEVSNRGLNYLPYAHFSEEAGRLSGILPLTAGGTGAKTAEASRENLGLDKVDNTADADKPVSGLVLAQLNNKEVISNKSISIVSDSASHDRYPSVKAVKEYVENRTANVGIVNQASFANVAAKATVLETPRTINGIPFDGSNSVTIPLDVSSSFSSIRASNFTGDLTGNASTATTALTANSASTAISATYATTANTATTLLTSQTIFGYPFDGSVSLSGVISPTYGGTGINNGNKTISLGGNLVTSGNYSTTINTTGTTNITLPTSGTIATLAGTETLTNKTFVNSSLTGTLTLGGTAFPSTSGTTGQVLSLTSAGVASWMSASRDGFDETTATGSIGNLVAVSAGQTNFTLTQTPMATTKLKMYVNGILISQNAYSYKTTSAFSTNATVPTPYLAYVTANNGSYVIALGDRIQFVYSY